MSAEELVEYIFNTTGEHNYEFILVLFDVEKEKKIGCAFPKSGKDEEIVDALTWFFINNLRAKYLFKEAYDLAEDNLAARLSEN